MNTNPLALPASTWQAFVARGGLARLEPLPYQRPLTSLRLAQPTAQAEADRQRQGFIRLIGELFPLDALEAYIHANLAAGIYPSQRTFDLNAGLLRLLERVIAREAEPVPAPFDLTVPRPVGRFGTPPLDDQEYRFAIQLLRLRPALALSVLFLRGYLVMWARALQAATHGQISAQLAPTFSFFLNSWNQGSLVTVLYPAIALHLRPLIAPAARQAEEPAFTPAVMLDVMAWLSNNRFFVRHAMVSTCGYDARLTCAATGMLNQALGKRAWLNTIFESIVTDQAAAPLATALKRVVLRGDQLADFCDGGQGADTTAWSWSLR